MASKLHTHSSFVHSSIRRGGGGGGGGGGGDDDDDYKYSPPIQSMEEVLGAI